MLYNELQNTKTEADLKEVYIRHLNLKNVSRNLVDIQTDKIWFEAKAKATSVYQMMTQLAYYVWDASSRGEKLPSFLCVVDNEKTGLIEADHILSFIKHSDLDFSSIKNASSVSEKQIQLLAKEVGSLIRVFYLENYEASFIDAVKSINQNGVLLKTNITPNNLKQVFDNWVDYVGKEIQNLEQMDYAVLFFTDIMSNNEGISDLGLKNTKVVINKENVFFVKDGAMLELASIVGYHKFWSMYNRPVNKEDVGSLLEKRDSLIPTDKRAFDGAFYTPLNVVDKAYEYLNNLLGSTWQKDYIVWDMCAGVGNLQVKHSNYRNIYISTLDNSDIELMKNNKVAVGAVKFQYDYLNDDVSEDGIDYSLTNKVPIELRQAIAVGKKILVLINPPYAEASSGIGKGEQSKTGVAKTKVAEHLMDGYGKSTNELFTQFVARIQKEIPNCTLAMFSKLKYVNAPNFEDFRAKFKAHYKGGFIVHSKAFDGLKGDFPIGFLVWDLENKKDMDIVATDIYDKNCINLGTKNFYNLPKSSYLNVWLKRPRANNQVVVPLSNAISVCSTKSRIDKWCEEALGYAVVSANDIQNSAQSVYFLSSVAGRGHGIYITADNLLDASCIFTARKIVKGTWINDRDQFLQPNKELSLDFKLDCLIYMLFNNSNLTASANGLEYNGAKYNLTNHFIPFSESQVDANDRFESDFMSNFLKDKNLSAEAGEVFDAGLELYKLYYATRFSNKIVEKYRLNDKGVGFYQVRKSLEDHFKDNISDEKYKQIIDNFKKKYNNLSNKILPLVYEYEFLKV